MSNFLQEASSQIVAGIGLIIAALMAVLCNEIKKAVEKFFSNLQKRNDADTCVEGVEQKHPELHGEEKFEKCEEYLCEMLDEKGLASTEIERTMLIEAAVHRMNAKKDKESKKAEKAAENKPYGAEVV